jgi:D-alanyl-D-alanine carboxypeptidase
LIRRPVSALLVATVALVATVTVLPWVRGDEPGAAALSSPDPGASNAVVQPSLGPEPSGIGSVVEPEVQPPGTSGPIPSQTAPSTAPSAQPASVTIPTAALQARLDTIRTKLDIPGASVTIIFPDGSSWTGVSGLANVRRETPVEADTAFAIASISKTYTAALILELAEDGALDLDARVSRYLPDLPLVGKTTIRQLLDHTSGLTDYFLHGKIDARLLADKGHAWTAAETLKYVRKPAFRPGRGWLYSNTNYYLLALVAEAVDGRPLAEQLRTRFLDPLELTRTYEQVDEERRGPIAHGYRVTGTAGNPRFTDLGDKTDLVPFTSVVTAAHGAGSIAASSGDVARWARALYGGTVLSDTSLAAMVADARRTARFNPKIPYGLGVQLVALDGHRALGHSGRLTGFRSVVRHLPREGITIAVLTNESRHDPTRIASSLLKIALRATAPS